MLLNIKKASERRFGDVVADRRSIFPKDYTGELVADETVQWILENSLNAPSHRMIYPWRYRVISGDKKAAFAKLLPAIYREIAADNVREAKANKLTNNVEMSSHVILISMYRKPGEKLPIWEDHAAIGASVQNIYLSVAAAGIGGYWSSPEDLISRVGEEFNIGENETCLGMFFLGVPKAQLPEQSPKPLPEERITWL